MVSKQTKSKSETRKACVESLWHPSHWAPGKGGDKSPIPVLVGVGSIKGESVCQTIYSLFIV